MQLNVQRNLKNHIQVSLGKKKKKNFLPPRLKQLQIIIVYFPGEKGFQRLKMLP